MSLRKSQKDLAKARQAIDDELARRLQIERVLITESEQKKARIALAADLKQRDRLLRSFRATLTPTMQNWPKLNRPTLKSCASPEKLMTQSANSILSVQKKVQESLATVRDQAKAEAEDNLKARLSERDAQISQPDASVRSQI